MMLAIDGAVLEQTIFKLDQLLKHLKSQGKPSKQDVTHLRELVIQLDTLLIRLKNSQSQNTDLVAQDLIRYLETAVEHLRHVLVREEATEHTHSEESHQTANDALFAELLRHIQQL